MISVVLVSGQHTISMDGAEQVYLYRLVSVKSFGWRLTRRVTASMDVHHYKSLVTSSIHYYMVPLSISTTTSITTPQKALSVSLAQTKMISNSSANECRDR